MTDTETTARARDAALIALCARLIAACAAADAVPDEDDDGRDAAVGRAFSFLDEILAIRPASRAGRRAKARAALAIAMRRTDGLLADVDPGSPTALAWQCVAEAAGVPAEAAGVPWAGRRAANGAAAAEEAEHRARAA
jgi:hypothetical protein